MAQYNQDFDLFQRQFLIGQYLCCSRKLVRARAQHDTNQCILRHSALPAVRDEGQIPIR